MFNPSVGGKCDVDRCPIAARRDDELKWEPTLHAAEIGVGVKDGVVTLSGNVDSYARKGAAEQAVKRVAGVKAVAEEIKVQLPMFWIGTAVTLVAGMVALVVTILTTRPADIGELGS